MKNIGLALSSLVLIFICFDTATACWCRRETLYTEEEFRDAVADEFRHRDVVFSGEVIEVSQSQIKFKVAKVWKGEAAEEITLSSMYYVKVKGETFIECPYSFDVGKSYLVYAQFFESLLQVHECSRTQLLSKAARDMEALNKLKAQGYAHPLKDSGPSFVQWRNLTKPCS